MKHLTAMAMAMAIVFVSETFVFAETSVHVRRIGNEPGATLSVNGRDILYDLVSESGTHFVSAQVGQEFVLVLIGGGGGGSATDRYHANVRTGAGGSSGDIIFLEVAAEMVEGLGSGVRFDVEIGLGGQGGLTNRCTRDEDGRYFPDDTDGARGGPTVLTITGGDVFPSGMAQIVAEGGVGGADPHGHTGTTCWGDCDPSGYTTRLPPLGGIGAGQSILGQSGLANATIVPGETIIPRADGGAFAHINVGRGGDGGGYNATIGSVINPPGATYAVSDYADSCDVHLEAFGRDGAHGGVLVFPRGLSTPNGDLNPVDIVNALVPIEIPDEEIEVERAALSADLARFMEEVPGAQQAYPQVAAMMEREPERAYLALLEAHEAASETDTPPDPLPEYIQGGIVNPTTIKFAIWLGRLIIMAGVEQAFEAYFDDELNYNDPTFEGISTGRLNNELASLEEALPKLRRAFEEVLRDPNTLATIEYVTRRIAALRAEIARREVQAERARQLENRSRSGGGVVDDPGVGSVDTSTDIWEFIDNRGTAGCVRTVTTVTEGGRVTTYGGYVCF